MWWLIKQVNTEPVLARIVLHNVLIGLQTITVYKKLTFCICSLLLMITLDLLSMLPLDTIVIVYQHL
jgi:hypothetical protein